MARSPQRLMHLELGGKHDEAVDILRTGLTTPGISGLDCTRLHLSCGEVQLDAIRLRDAQSSAAAAASALPEASPSPQSEPLRLAASMLSVRALLSTGGRGDDAAACEEAAAAVLRACGSGASAAAAAGAHALLLGTALATGAPSALFGPAQAAVRGALAAEAASGTGGGAGDAARLHHALGGWLFAHGDADGARAHFDSAASAATVARADAARAACPATFEGAWAEVEADALLSLAQVDVAREEWAGAEEVLGRALKAAEEVSTEQHPRLAPVLLCLGKVYARTARVVFAEGLYRECAKLVRLEPGRPEVGAGVRAHASLAAVIAWQYHQLMTALPNRDYGGSATEFGGDTVSGLQRFDDVRGEGSFGILAYGSCGYTNSDGSLPFAKETYAAAADANVDYPGSCGRCYEVRCINGLVDESPGNPVSIEDGLFNGDPMRPYLANISEGVRDSNGREWPGNSAEANGRLSVKCWDAGKVIRVAIADSCPCTQVLKDGDPGVKPGGETRTQQWCCGNEQHFDLSYWAFEQLSHPVYGVMMIEYRPIDCYSGAELPLTPGYISKAIYRDVPQPGWSFYPLEAQQYTVSVPGIAPSGNGAACVSIAPGGGLSFRCRECDREGYQPFADATGVRMWIKPNSGGSDPYASSTPDGKIPGLKIYLLNEENKQYCGAEPVLGVDVKPDSTSGEWFKVTVPFGAFNCYDAKSMDNLSFENIADLDARFCIADLEIV
ncbi:hypothetical protein FOA52_003144 [Chlamydomonas sp. UWO 241]|nr:hypothetical protein FOA52_003144 [Chlamydomonas sp. UWO 241]